VGVAGLPISSRSPSLPDVCPFFFFPSATIMCVEEMVQSHSYLSLFFPFLHPTAPAPFFLFSPPTLAQEKASRVPPSFPSFFFSPLWSSGDQVPFSFFSGRVEHQHAEGVEGSHPFFFSSPPLFLSNFAVNRVSPLPPSFFPALSGQRGLPMRT